MTGVYIFWCVLFGLLGDTQSQSMNTIVLQRKSTSTSPLLGISTTVVQPFLLSTEIANSADGVMATLMLNVSKTEISRTVEIPKASSSFILSQVSRSVKSQTSGNVVTTPVTVLAGSTSVTFPSTPRSRQIQITNVTTKLWLPTTTEQPSPPSPRGTVIPAESPCREFYNETSLPRHLIEMAHFQMHTFYPLVYTYCSVELLPLICSVHLPMFDIVSRKTLQPCSNMCDHVSINCNYAVRKLNFPISTLLQLCSSKPTDCFLPRVTPKPRESMPTFAPKPRESNLSCCFEVKPQPFCDFDSEQGFIRSSLNNTRQDEVIFHLSTYLPLFHALDSLNESSCTAQLSGYLCLKKFQYCIPANEGGGCSRDILKPSREHCLYFTDVSSPCSLSRINNTLQNAGYNIAIVAADFDCSTLQSSKSGEFVPTDVPQRQITNGLRIPRLTNVAISRPNISSLNISWNILRDTKEISEYGILWRKIEGANSSNGETKYQHIHSIKEHRIFNNIPTLQSQYEVLVTAIGQNGIPQPFTTVILPLSKGYCSSEIVGSREAFGIFMLPDTLAGSRATLACPYNNDSVASRDCLSTTETGSGGVWGPIIVTECKYNDQRSKTLFLLSQKKINSSNVVNSTRDLRNLSSANENNTLNPGDIDYIATILEHIALVKGKANEILDDFLATIDNLLDAELKNILRSQETRNSSSRIVQTLNTFAESLVIGPEGELETAKRNFDINLQTVHPDNFSGLNFSGIMSVKNQSETQNNRLSPMLSPSLIIPRTIFNESTDKNSSTNQTVIFVLYRETKFFRLSLADTSRTSNRLNSLVIAGSIKGISVANLSFPVNIALPSIKKGDTKSTLCSYWDFRLGNWSQEGCKFERVLGDGRVLCSCDHFTNFAMLMDIAPGEKTVHDKILGVISYVGCALSLAGLILTIITILILRDLRTQIPSQILLNFCVALSLTLIVFLAAVEKSKTSSLAGCRTAAIALHYFSLAAFLWMAVEAYNMYWAFVKVFSAPSQSRLLMKCCVFAWGTPAVIVGITMIAALDKYGDQTYCRLHGVPFIVAFLTPTILILVGNIVAFCFIIRSLLKSGNKVTSDKKTTGYQQARQGIAIMVLLGLTWLFGILAINDAKLAFQYLFCIFNALQGLFVFIFFVVLPNGTRRKLQTLRKRKTYSHRRDIKLHMSGEDSSQFNQHVYTNTNTLSSGTNESSKCQNPTFDNPVSENHLKSGSDFDGENDMDRFDTILDDKFNNEVWLNPNLTRYSVRKNGSSYITTIELSIK